LNLWILNEIDAVSLTRLTCGGDADVQRYSNLSFHGSPRSRREEKLEAGTVEAKASSTGQICCPITVPKNWAFRDHQAERLRDDYLATINQALGSSPAGGKKAGGAHAALDTADGPRHPL